MGFHHQIFKGSLSSSLISNFLLSNHILHIFSNPLHRFLNTGLGEECFRFCKLLTAL